MSDTSMITVRLDAALKQKLEALAQSTQRSKSWLAAEAIAAYVDQEAWQIQQIEAAMEQANQPDIQWIAHEEVSDWLKTWGTDDERLPHVHSLVTGCGRGCVEYSQPHRGR